MLARDPTGSAGVFQQAVKGWVPKLESLDDLLDADEAKRVVEIDAFSSVYAAFQSPVLMSFDAKANGKTDKEEEALAYTFEDALALANIEIFRKLDGAGLVGKFRKAIAEAENVSNLTKKFHAAVEGSDKGRFALDVIFGVEPSTLAVPGYIHAGLLWLEKQLANRDERSLVAKGVSGAEPAKEAEDGARA